MKLLPSEYVLNVKSCLIHDVSKEAYDTIVTEAIKRKTLTIEMV